MDWLANLFGLQDTFHHFKASTGGGVLQPTSSESILVAIIAAREKFLREKDTRDQSSLVIYASTQTHSSATKAARVFNLRVRLLDVDTDLALNGDSVAHALEEDRQNGLVPFIVIATIGTTSTGAVDRIDSIGKVIEREGMWLHIDSAWAGTHLAVPEIRNELMLDAVNEYADSINIGMHKVGVLFVNKKYLLMCADGLG